ncbi:MAG: hypothetical protein AAGA92_09190 [Planctomycetota bacterium]
MAGAPEETQQLPANRLAAAKSGAEPAADGDPFVGKWNRLVSTTNWEKGRIICEWRGALMSGGAESSEYSDDAWANLVGGVTGQHVGRLRRVYQRFGDVFERFEGVYWSHFHAGIDWDDAEMWLEGAVQNGWSVSQMRGQRWETVGAPGEQPPAADEPEPEGAGSEGLAEESAVVVDPAGTPISSPSPSGTTSAATTETAEDAEPGAGGDEADSIEEAETPDPVAKSARLNVAVDDLPDDLADAFEQFKLAIIANRRGGWKRTTPESVLDCLDALRQLTLADGS